MHKLKLLAGSLLATLFIFPAFSSAQTISIVSGNGQLICPDCIGLIKFAPLVVQVNSAAGSPMANTTVTWTVTQLGLPTVTATSETNASGQASYDFQGPSFFIGSFLQATVVAEVANDPTASVTFVETTALPTGTGTPAAVAALSPNGALAPSLSGSVGTTVTTPIMVSVYPLLGTLSGPVAGVSVMLQSAGGPTVSCAPQAGQQPGVVLTNSAGIATCTPVFGDVIGTGSYTINVGGGFTILPGGKLTVTGGAPAIVKYVSGNNQTVNPGVKAPLALEVEVTDSGGNPSADTGVTWSVTGGVATLSNEITTTPTDGLVSAFVTPTTGPVQVKVALASNSAISYTFTINVNTIITALQTIAGGGQSANEGVAFANPLIVQANDNGVPLAGITVNFAVTSGPATLSAASATTNAQGQAQVTATAGATSGPVVITASVASGSTTYSQTFDLTVNTPGPTITGIVNAASYQSQYVSPCSLAIVSGTGLASGLQGVAAPPIAPQMQVNGVTVQFGGVPAPILWVANENGQESMAVQVPCTVPVGTVQLVATADNFPSQPFSVTVSQYSPGIFQFTDTDGKVRAVLVRQDGSFISLANPAQPGDTLRMYVTGLGQTTPPLVTNEFDPLAPDASGTLVPQDLPVSANLIVGVNNGGVVILGAKYAYGMVGVYEVEFQVPTNTPAGINAPFAIVVYQNSNQLFWGNASLIPIQ